MSVLRGNGPLASTRVILISAGAGALLIVVIGGAYLLGSRGYQSGSHFEANSTKNTGTGTAAVAACVAYHGPNYSDLHGSFLSGEQIDSQRWDARTKANLAAGLDPRWNELARSMNALTVSGRPDYVTVQNELPLLTAQCLLTGAGDIGTADLVPSPAPS